MTEALLEPRVATRTHRLLVLSLAGTQSEMGRQHGALLREHGGHAETVAYYGRMPEILMGGDRGGVPTWVLRPVLGTALRLLHQERPRDLRARSRAFFEALGYPGRNSEHLFVMDLLQNAIGFAGRFGLGPSRRLLASAAVPACSSVVVWGRSSEGGTLRHARNFDFPGSGVWDREPAVVFCAPDRGQRYGFVTTRGADVPAVTAWNESGITVGPHTRFHRDVRLSGRGIVDLCHEVVRRARSLADAVDVVRERPVASTWGILVSSARERSALLIETTGRSVEVVRPEPGDDFLGQTNRYRSESLRRDEVAPMAGFVANSDGRARTIRRRLASGDALSTRDLEQLLGSDCDPEGCARPAGGVLAQPITVQSAVVEPEAGTVRVSVGHAPTGAGPYVTVPFEWGSTGSRTVVAEDRGERDAAREAFVRAASLEGRGAPRREVLAAVELAASLDPREPTYRLIAGALTVGHDPARAHEHLRRGLESERAPFQRAQLLLWASRAARAAGRSDEARAHVRELLAMEHPLVHDHQAMARREEARPPSPRALRRVAVSLVFPDATLA